MIHLLVCIVLLHTCYSEFTVHGRIDIVQPADSEADTPATSTLHSKTFEVGDQIHFNFSLNFTGTKDLSTIDLFISGSSMKFIWTIPNGGMYAEMESEVVPGDVILNKMEQHISQNEDRTVGKIQLRNNQVPLKSAAGRFVMKIVDQRNVHSAILVQPGIGESTTIYSEQLKVFVPSFNVSQAFPETISMKEKTSFHANITVPLLSFSNAYAKLYMPYNEEENEAKMTVVDFAVSAISGVDTGIMHILLGLLNSGISRFSRSATTEEDTAIIRFPPFNNTDGNSDIVTLAISCLGKLQDFKGFTPGQEIEIGTALKINEDFIWVGDTRVVVGDTSDSTIPERPVLNADISEITKSRTNGIINIRLKLTIVHENKSNGTAYDIAVGLYFPPTVTYVKSSKRFVDVVKRANQIESDSNLYFELTRVSFPHTSRAVFNVTIDTTTDLFQSTKTFSINYEVVYKGWRNNEEFSNDLQVLELFVDRNTEEPTDFFTGLKCSCPWRESDKTCACCKRGGCQCGTQNPYKCAPCNNPYRCVDTVNGYYKSSILHDLNGTTFICDDRSKMRPGRTFAACMARTDSGDERDEDHNLILLVIIVGTVLSPSVSALLGINSDSSILYGVSNNGQGYVISMDLGDIWYAIPNLMYFTAVKSTTFINATLM